MIVKMTLGKRIASGTVIMLVLMVVVGASAIYNLQNMLQVSDFYSEISGAQNQNRAVGEYTVQFLLQSYTDNKEKQDEAAASALNSLANSVSLLNRAKSNPSISDENLERLEAAETLVLEYKKTLNAYIAADADAATVSRSMAGFEATVAELIEKGKFKIEKVKLSFGLLTAAYTTYKRQSSDANWEKSAAAETDFAAEVSAWNEFVQGSDKLRVIGEDLAKTFVSLKTTVAQYHEHELAQAVVRGRMDGIKAKLDRLYTELGDASILTLNQTNRTAFNLIIIVIGASLVFGTVFSAISIRMIVGKIKTVIDRVMGVAGKVSSCAGEITTASQSLAGGTSEQAASIEETSASLEEMATMTKKNADNALEANQLMQETNAVVAQANSAMDDLQLSMTSISEASENTQKVITTIDEIAFQTNLLALNAAVEAARAGEAGAGFAVVADEVRNLALRAAEAAKTTAELIDETVVKIASGASLLTRTNDSFSEVSQASGKVGGLVSAISAACSEQSKGIEEINTAVLEVDKVTQRNAANSEESAAAAAEMNAQSDEMQSMVDALVALIQGRRTSESSSVQDNVPAEDRGDIAMGHGDKGPWIAIAHTDDVS